jgi:hypothetical protein
MEQRRSGLACVRLGMRAAWRRRGLVVLVWALFLAASLLAAAPAWRWWNAALSVAPEGDRLLDGLNVPLLRELSHYDRSPIYAVAFASLSAFLLAMLVLNPFVAGGILSALRAGRERELIPVEREHEVDRDPSGVAPQLRAETIVVPGAAPAAPVTPAAPAAEAVGDTRFKSGPPVSIASWFLFFRGGAAHYGLFLRLLLLAGVVGALLAGLFLLVLVPIEHYVDINNWERPFLLVSALFPMALATAWGLASVLLDIARIRAMREGERRAWRAMRGALRFVWRHAGATLAVAVAFALLTALTFAVYFAVASAFTPKSWLVILIAIVWQQALSLARAGLRVSWLAGELELVSAREPMSVRATFGPNPTV